MAAADIDVVDAETNEVPVRSMKVSRTRQGQLFLDGIKDELATRGQILMGVNDGGVPAYNEGWTSKAFLTNPVRLSVGPKPGIDTMHGSEVCACAKIIYVFRHLRTALWSACSIHAKCATPFADRFIPQMCKCNKSCFMAALQLRNSNGSDCSLPGCRCQGQSSGSLSYSTVFS